jgi:hypothetical protein
MNKTDPTKGAGNQGVPDFDQYVQKPVYIPFFIWDDGELRPFKGYCRGIRPFFAFEDWQVSIGVYTEEGKYFSVLIDTRVHCAVPQFWIDGKPFDFPIVRFATVGAMVDPATGILKPPFEAEQGQAGQHASSTNDATEGA